MPQFVYKKDLYLRNNKQMMMIIIYLIFPKLQYHHNAKNTRNSINMNKKTVGKSFLVMHHKFFHFKSYKIFIPF